MAGEQWFYVQAGQRLGPVPADTLKALLTAGSVQGGDLVWTEGMADWVAAVTVPSLHQAPRPAPSPTSSSSPYSQPQPAYGHPQQPDFGRPVPSQPNYGQPVGYYSPTAYGSLPQYAGFWLRFVAAVIDGIILGILSTIIFSVLSVFTGLAIVANSYGTPPTSQAIGAFIMGILMMYVIMFLLQWIYFATTESSSMQGSLGKRALGLKVTDSQGQRVTFGRASGRYWGKLLSGMFFGIGFLIAGVTQRKQALHDMMADCLVIRG